MAQNRHKANDVQRMLCDEKSEMDVDNEEESDFYESGTQEA